MGHLQESGELLVPVDGIIEAARSIGAPALVEAAETINSNDEMVSMLRSGTYWFEEWSTPRNAN